MSDFPLTDALDRARFSLAGNLLDRALGQVREALRQDPHSAEARLLEARIRLRRHEPRLALGALDQKFLEQPADDAAASPPPELAMLRAHAMAGAGQIEAALGAMRQLAGDYPDDVTIQRALVGLLLHHDQDHEAAEVLGRVVRLDPDDRAAARLRSDLLAAEDPEAALATLGPINGEHRWRAARLCVACGRLAEAEEHYAGLLDRAASADRVRAQVRLEAAAVAESRGDHAVALERLEPVCHAPTTDAAARGRAWRDRGRLLLQGGRWAEAGRAYHRATRIEARDAAAWAGLVTAAERAGRERLAQRADRHLRPLVSRVERRRCLSRLFPHAVNVGTLERPPAADTSPLQQMLNDASAVMRKVAEKHPDRADVHYHRAVCDAGRGEVADAAASLDVAVQINPRYAAALAMADRLSGDGAEWE
jgi:tetratricopeptide (TPR) repeat protein